MSAPTVRDRPDVATPGLEASLGSDSRIVALALAAAALALLAPLLGRGGAARLADAVMIAGALCGVGAFALAAIETARAARRAGGSRRSGGDK